MTLPSSMRRRLVFQKATSARRRRTKVSGRLRMRFQRGTWILSLLLEASGKIGFMIGRCMKTSRVTNFLFRAELAVLALFFPVDDDCWGRWADWAEKSFISSSA